jgi:hypothetical protein
VIKINGVEISDRTYEYLETALWADTVLLPVPEDELVDGCMDVDEDHPLHGITDGHALDEYFNVTDFTEESLRAAERDCDAFFTWIEDNNYTDRVAGYAPDDRVVHDLWLTRNGHGAGFWDGDYGDKLGRELTIGAKLMGGCTIIVGENGMLEFM